MFHIIVPKRAFRDEDIPKIRELLRRHVTQRPLNGGAKRSLVLWVVLIVLFLAIWQLIGKTPAQPPTMEEQEPSSADPR